MGVSVTGQDCNNDKTLEMATTDYVRGVKCLSGTVIRVTTE